MNLTQTWYAANGSGGQGIIIDCTGGRTVAVTYDKKDAPLVAAAPELLEALEAVKEQLSKDYQVPVSACVGGIFATINAAIAKARGE